MSLLVARIMRYVQNQLPNASVSCVGTTVFVRDVSDSNVQDLHNNEVCGRNLHVNTANDHTDAAIIRPKQLPE